MAAVLIHGIHGVADAVLAFAFVKAADEAGFYFTASARALWSAAPTKSPAVKMPRSEDSVWRRSLCGDKAWVPGCEWGMPFGADLAFPIPLRGPER